MKTQINVSNTNLTQFFSCCERLNVIYHQIEVREYDPRYEVLTATPSILYYLGCAVGWELGHSIHTETFNQVQNGN
jgi:hypothetical protein